MKSISYPQFRIVQGYTAKELTDELNAALKDLKGQEPIVTFSDDSLTARIKYEETERDVPECLEDEYRLKGVQLYCEDCPYFERFKKADGTEDLRKNVGMCPVATNGMTHRRKAACETLFKMINEGGVKLCLVK